MATNRETDPNVVRRKYSKAVDKIRLERLNEESHYGNVYLMKQQSAESRQINRLFREIIRIKEYRS